MNNINKVEVDGVCFETLMPERELLIPTIKPRVSTRVQLGIRITNHTSSSLRFCFYNAFFMLPELVAPDGQTFKRGYYCERSVTPQNSDFLLAIPGEAITFYPATFLYWQQNPKKKRDRKLTLSIFFKESDGYIFESLYSGSYRIDFVYEQSRSDMEKYYKSSVALAPSILQEVWSGNVTTPTIDFNLLQE